MSTAAAPPPIPGEHIDPPPPSTEKLLHTIEDRSGVAGSGFRAFTRFTNARASLLAAGTTYYIFLAMFALLAVAFGVTLLIGSEAITDAVNDAVNSALPNLTGDEGVNSQSLQEFAKNASLAGLLVLLYSGSGAMVAASDSLHQIYGAPKDGRNFVVARLRLLGWMVLLAPLILMSFAASVVVSAFAQPILDWLASTSTAGQMLLRVGTTAVSFAIGFLVVYLMLGHLGGIRPPRRPRVIGALVAAVGVEILKTVMGSIVAWSVAKPQYGAFAVPITVLLVLYLLTMVTYVSAALTAGLAEKSDATVPDLEAELAAQEGPTQPPQAT
jgi:membrane protein